MSLTTKIRRHYVGVKSYRKTVIMSFPDNRQGFWYKKVGQLSHNLVGLFDYGYEFSLEILKWVLYIPFVFLYFLVWPIIKICEKWCKMQEKKWERETDWIKVSNKVQNPCDLVLMYKCQDFYAPDIIKEMREIVQKHQLMSEEELEASSPKHNTPGVYCNVQSPFDKFPYVACHIAENMLQGGNTGTKQTFDLRRLIDLADSIEEVS